MVESEEDSSFIKIGESQQEVQHGLDSDVDSQLEVVAEYNFVDGELVEVPITENFQVN